MFAVFDKVCMSPHPIPAASTLSGRLHALLALLASPQTAAPDNPNVVTALILAADDVLREWAGRPPLKPGACRSGSYRALRRALEHIKANYAEPISLPDIAAHAA